MESRAITQTPPAPSRRARVRRAVGGGVQVGGAAVLAAAAVDDRVPGAGGAVGGRAADRAELRPLVVDRVGPRDRRSPPRLLDRWWPVVEAAAGAVHGALRGVDGRRADAVGDHRPGRRLALFGRGVPPGLQADQRGAVDARGRRRDRGGRRGAHAGVVLLHVPRDVGADARGAGAVGRRPAPRRQAGHGVRARGRGGFDPARGVAVHRALRAVVVAARAAASVVGRRRMGLDPGAVVRASVGGVRSAVPGLRPRQGLQRPSRQEPVPRGADDAARTCRSCRC